MGFGYLVLAFLIWLNPVYSGFTEWIAYTLILTGASKLAPYGKGYKLTAFAGIPGLVLSFANFILCGADLLGIINYRSMALYSIIMLSLMLCAIATRLLVLFGTCAITAETGLETQRLRSAYCMILYSFVFIFDILQSTRLIPATSTGYAIVMFAHIIIGTIAFFVLFACLRMITLDEGDELPPEKESKINGWWKKIKDISGENEK